MKKEEKTAILETPFEPDPGGSAWLHYAEDARLLYAGDRQESHASRQSSEYARKSGGLTIVSEVGVNNPNIQSSLAAEGHGIVRLPIVLAKSLVSEGRLRQILLDEGGDKFPLVAMYPPRSYVTAKARAFIDWVSELEANTCVSAEATKFRSADKSSGRNRLPGVSVESCALMA